MTKNILLEGPQFSTRAESKLYRSWGGTVINMSALPEAKLAREAEMAYQMICMATDYDCWRADEPDAEQQHQHQGGGGGGGGGGDASSADVTVEIVMRHMRANAGNARRFVAAVLDELSNVAATAAADGSAAGEQNAVIMARHLEGQSRAATLMTAAPGRKPEAVAKIRWLFPDYFPED